MYRREKKRYWQTLICMAATVIFGVAVSTSSHAASTGITSDNIREMEGQIDAAEQEKKDLQNGLTDLKKIKEELENSKNDLTNYVRELDGNLADIEQKIEELKQLIAEKETEIEQTSKDLEEAQKKEQEQYEAMKIRIQFMYER